MTTNGDVDIDTMLEQLNGYIQRLAKQHTPRHVSLYETLDLETEELAQNIRIKLWLALRKEAIGSPKAYIRRIAFNEAVNMIRGCKKTLPLLFDEDGEPYQGNTIQVFEEEMQDPARQLEQEETLADYARWLANVVDSLPARQRRALLCTLKDQCDDIISLINTFKEQKIDVEATQWPEDKVDRNRLKSSLSVTRKKLRQLLEKV